MKIHFNVLMIITLLTLSTSLLFAQNNAFQAPFDFGKSGSITGGAMTGDAIEDSLDEAARTMTKPWDWTGNNIYNFGYHTEHFHFDHSVGRLPLNMDWTNSGYSISGATTVAEPYITRHNDTIYVFYEYQTGVPAQWHIGLAWKTDSIGGSWTVVEPLLSPTNSGADPDSFHIADPTVLHIPWAEYNWHIWFDMYGPNGWTIGHAYSNDPTSSWIKQNTGGRTDIVINQGEDFGGYDKTDVHCPEAYIYGGAVHLLYGAFGSGHTEYDAMLAIANDYLGLGYSFEKWGVVTHDSSTAPYLSYRLQSPFMYQNILYAIMRDNTASDSLYWFCSNDGGKSWNQFGKAPQRFHSFLTERNKIWGVVPGGYFYYLDLENLSRGSYDTPTISDRTNLPITWNVYNAYCIDGKYVLRAKQQNIFVGDSIALNLSTGNYNTCISNAAGRSLSSGASNTNIGYGAGYTNQTGNYNINVGAFAGHDNTGSGVTSIGNKAGQNFVGNRSLFIGYEAGKYVSSGDYRLYIDVSDTAAPLIYGEFDNNIARIHGDFDVVKNTDTTKIRPTAVEGDSGLFEYAKYRFAEIIKSSTGNITAPECRSTLINNYGQGAASTLTLPACATGLNCQVLVITTGNAIHVDVQAGDKIYLDGTALDDGDKISNSSPAVGDAVSIIAAQTGASEWNWIVRTLQGTWIDGNGGVEDSIGAEWYAAVYPDSGPIGGGYGYPDTVKYPSNNHTTSYVVTGDGSPKDSLLYYFSVVDPGDTVYLSTNVEVDMDAGGETENTIVPAGVLFASSRGCVISDSISWGGLVYSNDKDDGMSYLFRTGGTGTRISGLRIRGPDGEISDRSNTGAWYRDINGVRIQHGGCIVDNCEIYNWPRSGVGIAYPWAGTSYVKANHIHDVERNGLGYGVVLDDSNFCMIYANYMNHCRHFISGTSDTFQNYKAYYNIFDENTYLQGGDRHAGAYNKGGMLSEYHHCTFRNYSTVGNQFSVLLEGIPDDSGKIWNCHSYEDDSADAWSLFSNENNRVEANHYGLSPPEGLSARIPTASISVNTDSGPAPLAANFDGTGSSDPDGSIIWYEWLDGEGGYKRDSLMTHEYESLGIYQAHLIVHDDDGNIGRTTQEIQVVPTSGMWLSWRWLDSHRDDVSGYFDIFCAIDTIDAPYPDTIWKCDVVGDSGWCHVVMDVTDKIGSNTDSVTIIFGCVCKQVESGQYIEIEIYFDDIALLHPASMSDVLNGNFNLSGQYWDYDYDLQGFLAVCYYTAEEERFTAMITQQYNTDAALYSYGAISQDIDISGQ